MGINLQIQYVNNKILNVTQSFDESILIRRLSYEILGNPVALVQDLYSVYHLFFLQDDGRKS